MSSIPQRMRKLQARLLAIRLGSGALVLPKEITRIHMRFAARINGGHMGPRKFWRHELVRLKYHNPAVTMTTDRTAEAHDPAIMSIHYAPKDAIQSSKSATSSPAPVGSTSGDTATSEHTSTETVETIDMKGFTNTQILEALINLTKAYPAQPAPEDQAELAELEEQRIRSARDSALSQQVRAKLKREQDILAQAKQAAASMN